MVKSDYEWVVTSLDLCSKITVLPKFSSHFLEAPSYLQSLPCTTNTWIVNVFCASCHWFTWCSPLIFTVCSPLYFGGLDFFKQIFRSCFPRIVLELVFDEIWFLSIHFNIVSKFFSVCWAIVISWFYLLYYRFFRSYDTKAHLHIAVELCFSHYRIWFSMSILKFY